MKIKYIQNAILVMVLGLFPILQMNAQSRPIEILETPTDARSAAMGGISLMSTDRSYLYVNPTSLLYGDKHYTMSITGMMFPKDEAIDGRLMFGGVSAGWRFLDRHVVYAGYRYQGGLSYESIIDQFGNKGKEYKPFDWSVDLGYAFRFTDQISAFATGSFIQSYTGRAAYAGAFSVGMNYLRELQIAGRDAKMNAALKVADFGTPIYYKAKEGYSLPTNAQLTADLALPLHENHALNVALGAKCYFMPKDANVFQANLGAEYTLYKMVSLRAGYQYGTRSTSLWTAGIGAKVYGAKLDFAYLGGIGDFASNRMMITLSYDF